MHPVPQMPSCTPSSKTSVSFERAQAKARVVRAFHEGKDWREVATANDVNYHTARRAVLAAGAEPKQRGGLRSSSVKMTVEVMSKLEELIDEDCRMTLEQLRDRLHSDLGVDTHEGSVKKQENARFMADLFVAALRSEEYEELQPAKVVIVTDNAPVHSEVERLVREYLAADGIVNLNMFVVLRLGPYRPMLNPIEGCWNSLKAKMRRFMAERKQEVLVRGEYATFTEHCMQLMKEVVEFGKTVITARLVWRYERHCLRHCFAAEKGDDMKLGA
uniref:Tc1-like transposase DDE domain-containing protein n=1 Tax=Phytophthora ramorum TaxID=164328 RepID=H3GJD3_PHYRM